MTQLQRIRYRFDLPDGSQKTLDFFFDSVDFRLLNPAPAEPPFWTELAFNRCSNCPLEDGGRCPSALHMVKPLEGLEALVSFDTVRVTVAQAERTVYTETSVQQALSSVLGLVMATAGCPWTAHLRPMARFHLPFANEAETMYRTISMFLVARQLRGAGAPADAAAGGVAPRAGRVAHRDVGDSALGRRGGAAARPTPTRRAASRRSRPCMLTCTWSIAPWRAVSAPRRAPIPRATPWRCSIRTPCCCRRRSNRSRESSRRCSECGEAANRPRFNLPRR